ncbi:MAG: hypothetical protein ACFFC7_29425 [Candidatus Hermodarchaeota archaeon]
MTCSKAKNYITNSSFEFDLSRWDIYDGTWIRDNTRTKHGNWSCKVESINDGDESDPFYVAYLASERIDNSLGSKNLDFSIWIYLNGTASVNVDISWWDGFDFVEMTSIGTTQDPGWNELKKNFTAKSTVNMFFVAISASSASFYFFHFDDVRLEVHSISLSSSIFIFPTILAFFVAGLAYKKRKSKN